MCRPWLHTLGLSKHYVFFFLFPNKKVHFLPLPPLRLDQHDQSLLLLLKEKGANNTQLQMARTSLWFAQSNARGLSNTYTALKNADPEELAGKLDKSKAAVANTAESTSQAVANACSKRLCGNGKANRVEPADFIRTLFWPRDSDFDTKFSPDMAATLLAEAAGLCSIIREDGMDRVYAHPSAVRVFCEQMEHGDAHTKTMLAAVIELCKALEELSEVPGQHGSGKLYEKVMFYFLRCRVMTSFDREISVAELLCLPTKDALGSVKVAACDPIPIPRAACNVACNVDANDKKHVVEANDKEHGAEADDEQQAACFKLVIPRSATVYEHKHNLVEDARLILGDVCIVIRCKEEDHFISPSKFLSLFAIEVTSQ